MEEFRKMQANLCGSRDRGTDVPEDRRHYGPHRDCEDDNDSCVRVSRLYVSADISGIRDTSKLRRK